MYPSPLTLERHFFTKIALDTHVNGQIGTPNLLDCQSELGQAKDNPRMFQITMRLKIVSPPDAQATYTGEIDAVGLFKVSENWPADNILKLVEANGRGMLFGAIREMILNLTLRGPFPPIMLNTFSFQEPKEAGKAGIPADLVAQK